MGNIYNLQSINNNKLRKEKQFILIGNIIYYRKKNV